MLRIFPCVYWLPVCLLWRNDCLGLLSERFKCYLNLAGKSGSKSLLSPGYFADLFTEVKDARGTWKGQHPSCHRKPYDVPFSQGNGCPLVFSCIIKKRCSNDPSMKPGLVQGELLGSLDRRAADSIS